MMDTSETNNQPSYSLESKLPWVDAPLCPGYSITYTSATSNDYGDALFYVSQADTPNRVRPTINPKVRGFFAAYPGGLHIDQNTGVIDVNKSDTGIRYKVEFTPCDQDKPCVARTYVVISGINYEGRIVSLSKSPERGADGYIAEPYFDGVSRDKKTRKGEFGVISGRHSQSGFINLQGLIINPATGEINLKETVLSGALGFRKNCDGTSGREFLPENGISREFKIPYRLEDGRSNRNETNIRIHFYNTKEDIPYELRRRIEQHNNALSFPNNLSIKSLPLLLGTSLAVLPDSPWEIFGALVVALSSLFFLNTKADNPDKPREHAVTK